MNKIKSLQFIALTALLAVNAGLPLQANNSWSQQIIGGLFSRPSAEIAVGVGVAALAQATVQRAASYYTFPKDVWVNQNSKNYCLTGNQSFFAQGPYSCEYGVKHPQMGSYTNTIISSAAIGLCAAAAARIGASPLSASEVIKPVAIGAGIVAGSCALGYGIGYSLMHKSLNELESYDSPELRHNFRRYEAAWNAYNFASYATPLVVAGVGGYMIYDRCIRS